jgi:HEAT repeat protein
MRKRLMVGAGLLLGMVGIALLIPWSRMLVLGVLQHEPFYHSMPSSYWRELLADPLGGARANGWFGETCDASKELQQGGAGAVPVLAVLIHDLDPRVAQGALGVLAWIGDDARPAIPALKELVQASSNGGVSLFAGQILCRLEPECRHEVLTWQLSALRSRPTDEELGLLFRNIRPEDQDLVPILVEMLDDAAQREWHADIVQALTRTGGGARAVPAIARLLRDEDQRTKATAIAALGKVGGKDAASILGEALASEEQVLCRRWIARALSDIGPPAKAAAPTLQKALSDADGTVRFFALVALVNADCAQDDATNVLAEKLTDRDGHIQYYAADALGRLGPKARAAIPALLGALNDASSNFIRQHVADALKKVDPDAAAKVGIR